MPHTIPSALRSTTRTATPGPLVAEVIEPFEFPSRGTPADGSLPDTRSFYEIVTIETPTLGDRSYLVHDAEVGFVVDPQRDIDRLLEIANDRGVCITHVFETHVHNDYVTGGLALAHATGAAYHLNVADPVCFDRDGVTDGDSVTVSPVLRVRVLATPGHTFTHLSYALEVEGETVAAFTGGSLLYGATGRPDLLGVEHADQLAHCQADSARRLVDELPDEVLVLPTHGFGSFCSSGSSGTAISSTIGQEKRSNAVLRLAEDDYVASLLAGLDAYPAYYAHMARLNLAGPPAPDLSPTPHADPAELRRRIDAGEWIVDLRDRVAFTTGHLAGSVNVGLDGSFSTYLGWIIPRGASLTLLGETAAQLARAQRELVRIGIDRPAATASGGPLEWAGHDRPAQLRRASFADLVAEGASAVLDVRRRSEWDESHLAIAVHIPLHELLDRLDEIPEGEVWVHCAAGYSAATAASLLAKAGREVVVVDDAYANVAATGLTQLAAPRVVP